MSLLILPMNNYTSITDRTKIFAIRIIKAYGWLKTQNEECRVIGHQLLRSSISIGQTLEKVGLDNPTKIFLAN